MRIPKTIYNIKNNITFVLGLTLFVLFFCIIYTPTFGAGEEEVGEMEKGVMNIAIAGWYEHQGLCLPVCCAIIFATATLSRTLLLLTTHTARIKEMEYFLWQLGEVAVTALFCDLFLSLFFHINFFRLLLQVLLIYTSVAIYPYAFYWLLAERIDRDLRIAEAQHTILSLRRGEDKNNAISFVDEKGTVKLIVGADNVVCIESAGNYVNILYEKGGRLTRFSLRNTLKGIEGLCDELVRCHRSYYINIAKVQLLRKTPDGLFAEMQTEGVQDIPVSKSYAASVMQLFAERN